MNDDHSHNGDERREPIRERGLHGDRPARFAISAASALLIPEADADEQFARLKAELPSRAARRMSRLGLMLSHLIGQVGVGEETVVIYASMFGEGRTLECYLASFPHPSPLGFQSSIHPGGVEQALIYRQQPVREFFPVTASENLPLCLFRTLSQCRHAPRVLLLGGEECGSWLHDHGLAADTNFAFALLLEQPSAPPEPMANPEPSTESHPKSEPHSESHPKPEPHSAPQPQLLGWLCEGQMPPPLSPALGTTLLDLATALATREAIDFHHPDEGHWSILWRHTD